MFIPTGWHEQGRTAFSSPASANANTCSPPTGILVSHRKLAQGITGYNHNNIVPLPLRSPSPIPHNGEGWARNAGIVKGYESAVTAVVTDSEDDMFFFDETVEFEALVSDEGLTGCNDDDDDDNCP